MTEHEKKIYDGVNRSKIYERTAFAMKMWNEMTYRATRSLSPAAFNELFEHFLDSIIRTSRLDEEAHQKAIRRIENIKAWINSSEFNDTSKHYCMSITLLGYDNLEEMKKEITEYAPDLLDAFALYGGNGRLGDSFLLKDYEPIQENSTEASPEAENTTTIAED